MKLDQSKLTEIAAQNAVDSIIGDFGSEIVHLKSMILGIDFEKI